MLLNCFSNCKVDFVIGTIEPRQIVRIQIKIRNRKIGIFFFIHSKLIFIIGAILIIK